MNSSPLKTYDEIREYLATRRTSLKFGPPQTLTWNYGNTITMRLVPDKNKPRALVPKLVVENETPKTHQIKYYPINIIYLCGVWRMLILILN